MAIKNVIAKGIGFAPGSTIWLPTHGFTPSTTVSVYATPVFHAGACYLPGSQAEGIFLPGMQAAGHYLPGVQKGCIDDGGRS